MNLSKVILWYKLHNMMGLLVVTEPTFIHSDNKSVLSNTYTMIPVIVSILSKKSNSIVSTMLFVTFLVLVRNVLGIHVDKSFGLK